MERQRVISSNLESVGYDPNAMVLEIEFNNGGVYQYFDVPEAVYIGLLDASSKGAYLHRHIKNKYRYKRI